MKWCSHFSREGIEGIPETSGAFASCALISIRDPKSPKPRLRCKFGDVLELEFHDFTLPEDEMREKFSTVTAAEAGMDADLTDWEKGIAERGYIWPKPEHAKQIADFIRKNSDKTILVHCEAGVSRSAAVCSVLHDLGWEYRQARAHGLTHANNYIVRMLRAELTKELEDAHEERK